MRAFCFSLFLCLVSLPLHAGWQRQDLDNGLQVFVKEDHRAPVVLVHVWYRAGSVDEPKGRTGIAHMLEHMMFKGTKLHPAGEYSTLIAERGGKHNAFTTADFTGYFVFIARDELPLVLDLESDRMVNLAMDSKAFDPEKQVVMEERRMRIEDQPVALFLEKFDEKAYGSGPYAHPVIGFPEDMKAFTLDAAKEWYQTWYAPQNAVLMVVGDIKTQDVFKLVQEKFGPLKNAGAPPDAIRYSARPEGQVSFKMAQKIEVPMLMMGYSVPVLQSAKPSYIPYALLLLRAYLAGSEDGILVRSLVKEKKLATEVSASYEATARLDTQFVVGVIPAKNVPLDTLRQSIAETLQYMKDHVIAEEELKRVKVQYRAQFIYQQDILSHQVEWLGSLLMANQSEKVADQFLDNIQSVTVEQIQDVVRTYFVDKRLTRGVLVTDTSPPEPVKKEQPKGEKRK